ncbi:uncharacterized protein K02A2.6-like isoform X2 [Corticium candelabrum]|uniref:uncharacterized protein K02A2.6-like isoform X2 n=1 Tax=Corticium candelabrum TaxID=121492 RepID=UPI002E2558FF|nr:uncharacterized protein K02A2.6-like isoform X2 [Corticium candelabrum]
MGLKKTLKRINERFMWHGIVHDTQTMIKTCNICQRANREMTTSVPELHPIPVKLPWYHIGIDFVGPITPVSTEGQRFILTISDYFSKWVEAVALPSKCASDVARALFKIFMRMGLPQVITTDQGSEFRNKLNRELMHSLGIKHRLTTAYHPQLMA